MHTVFVIISLVQEAGPASNGHVPTNPGENDYGKSLAEAAKGNSGQNASIAYHAQVQDPSHKTTADAKAAEWATHEAPNGKPFYHNLITGATQWEKPAALEVHNHAQVMHKQVEVVCCFTLACLYELHMIEHYDCANQFVHITKNLSGSLLLLENICDRTP